MPQPIRILHLFPARAHAPGLAAFLDIQETLTAAGITQEFVFLGAAPAGDPRLLAVPVRTIPVSGRATALLGLARMIWSGDYAAIHCHDECVVPGALAARLTGTPAIAHVHNLPVDPLARPSVAHRVLARDFARYLADSPAIGEELAANLDLPAGRVVTLSPPIDLAVFSDDEAAWERLLEDRELNIDGPLLVSTGELMPDDAFDILLRAMALVLKEIPSAKLLIVAEGILAFTLRSLADALGINKSALLVDDYAHRGAFLRRANLYVRSAKRDVLGVGLKEALALGLPAVATGLPAYRDLVAGTECAPSGDFEALAAAIVALLKDEPRRKKLAKAAPKVLAANLDPERFRSTVLDVYRTVTT